MIEEVARQWLVLTGKIVSGISLLPLVMCFIKWSSFREKPFRWFFFYLLSGAILNWLTAGFVHFATKYWNIVGDFLTMCKIDDTFFMDPLYYLRNALILAPIFKDITDQKQGKLLKIASLSYTLFIILNTCLFEGYQESQIIGGEMDSLFKTGLAIFILRILFLKNMRQSVFKTPYFWIAIGLLIIGSLSGLIDYLSNKMYEQTSVVFYQVHILKDVFMAFAFISFCIGIHFVSNRIKVNNQLK